MGRSAVTDPAEAHAVVPSGTDVEQEGLAGDDSVTTVGSGPGAALPLDPGVGQVGSHGDGLSPVIPMGSGHDSKAKNCCLSFCCVLVAAGVTALCCVRMP